jgi:hypothetical protein
MRYVIILCVADVQTEHHLFTIHAWSEMQAHKKAELIFTKEHEYPKNMVKLEHTVTLHVSVFKRVAKAYLNGFINGLQSTLKVQKE